MGNTRIKHGDHRILFHVGKELPVEGKSIMLVPGVQEAQGRGLYCTGKPDLRYKGSEYYKNELEIAPVFFIPMEEARMPKIELIAEMLRREREMKQTREINLHLK